MAQTQKIRSEDIRNEILFSILTVLNFYYGKINFQSARNLTIWRTDKNMQPWSIKELRSKGVSILRMEVSGIVKSRKLFCSIKQNTNNTTFKILEITF